MDNRVRFAVQIAKAVPTATAQADHASQSGNLAVMAALVETYRSQFAQEINATGIEGLSATLTERNNSDAKKA